MTTYLPAEDVTAAEFEDALSYRRSMVVHEIRLFYNGDAYAVRPRCEISLDREYMQFCDRCGQKLAWHRYHNAVIRSKR